MQKPKPAKILTKKGTSLTPDELDEKNTDSMARKYSSTSWNP